jgi:hypothetical protein
MLRVVHENNKYLMSKNILNFPIKMTTQLNSTQFATFLSNFKSVLHKYSLVLCLHNVSYEI